MIVALRVTKGESDSGGFVIFITYLAQVCRLTTFVARSERIFSVKAIQSPQSTWIHLSICQPITSRHREAPGAAE